MYDSVIARKNSKHNILSDSYTTIPLYPSTSSKLDTRVEPQTPSEFYSSRPSPPITHSHKKPKGSALSSLKDTLNALNDTSYEMKSVFQG